MAFDRFKDSIFGGDWSYDEVGIMFRSTRINYEDIIEFKIKPNNILFVKVKGNSYYLKFGNVQRERVEKACKYIGEHYGSQELREARKREETEEGIVYNLIGVRGKRMKVYDDRVVIKTDITVGSVLTHNATDGEKTIYYADCIGVQFKESGALIGYIQLETASLMMNNKGSNFFNENSFNFDENYPGSETNKKMHEVVEYIKERISIYKNKSAQVVSAVSSADEIIKFKELLDMGIITQEEFDAKKKQLLGL